MKTTPTRHRAASAFQDEPTADDRQEMEVAPTEAERRPPAIPPRMIAGVLGGATGGVERMNTVDPEADARRQERRLIEERAAREMREEDFPPADESKQRARDTMNEIRAHIQEISHSVRNARNDAGPGVER